METKFSIIIPVYNVEKYIVKCLESINSQSYKNFEAIIVNDGSLDNSEQLITKYIKRKKIFKYYKKVNGGLSDARNYGVNIATGDYLLFVDSDDYIEKDLLYNLNAQIKKGNDEIIKFNLRVIKDKKTTIPQKSNFINTNVDDAIKNILNDDFIEPAVMYCYKHDFWKKNKFKYKEGRYHEDFGLTPLVLMEAHKISSINYEGYNYVLRENSITTTKDINKELKKFNDYLYFFDENILKIAQCKNIKCETKNLLLSFYANGLINKTSQLENKNFEYALIEIKKRQLYKYLIDDTLKRKIKKNVFKIMPKIYIKGILK